MVAAAFEHLANDAGQPHLHTHVVLANLGARRRRAWGCLVGTELWRWREGIGAGFHLALRSRLAEAGFGFSWAISEGGLGEIASVPLEARLGGQFSVEGVRASARSFGSGSAATERAAQARTRQSSRRRPGPAERGLGPDGGRPGTCGGPWENRRCPPRRPRAGGVPGRWRPGVRPSGRPTCSWPWQKRCRRGSTWPERRNGRRSWCDASRPLPEVTGGAAAARAAQGWWTLPPLADQLDRRVLDMATEARFAHLAQVMPALAA